jgi:hypothetical protein
MSMNQLLFICILNNHNFFGLKNSLGTVETTRNHSIDISEG